MTEYEFGLVPLNDYFFGFTPREMEEDEPEELLDRIASAAELWGEENGYEVDLDYQDFRGSGGYEANLSSSGGEISGKVLYMSDPFEKFHIWLKGSMTFEQAESFGKWIERSIENLDHSYNFGMAD